MSSTDGFDADATYGTGDPLATLATLQEVTAAYSRAHDVSAVVAVTAYVGRVVLAADNVVIARLEPATRTFRMLGSEGLHPDDAAAYATWPADADLPSGDALRSRRPLVLRSNDELKERYPAFWVQGAARDETMITLPLLDGDEVVGILALGWRASGVVDEVGVALLRAIATQCAQALERARLYDAERVARQRAEDTAERLEALQTVTARLAGAVDVQQVADVIIEHATHGAGATRALLRRVEPLTGDLVLVGSRGLGESQGGGGIRVVPGGAAVPVADAVRRRAPVLVAGRADRDRLYPHLAGTPMLTASYLVLPLPVDERVLGALILGWDDGRAPSSAELVFLEALARQCGQALDRAELYGAEQTARRRAEDVAAQLRVQQELTARLSEAVDSAGVASAILDHATSALGALGGIVMRYDEDRQLLVTLALRGTDAGTDEALFAEDQSIGADTPAGDCLRRRAAVVVRDRTEREARYPHLVQVPGAAAFVYVPLFLDERAIGVLGLDLVEGFGWTVGDSDFLDALANQCAQALERARLYDTTRDVARTLQHSLLPGHPPAIPGVEIAVRYRPIGGRAEVGGDFYDVFRVLPGRWGVVIGDVSGKGVSAASLTALARYTVRAVAPTSAAPSDVLGSLNSAVLEFAAGDDRFCTVAYLDVRPEPGRLALRLSVGGHPLPLLRRADGKVEAVGIPGMAVGMLPVAYAEDVDLVMEPGDLLVMVTDGVTEARAPDGTWVPDVVERVLAGIPDPATCDAEDVADRIERSVLDVQAGRPRDDLAVVVLRVPVEQGRRLRTASTSASLTLERDPASVGIARRRAYAMLVDAGYDDAADVTALLVSEVVTNAILHARTSVGIRIDVVPDRVHVEVSDGSFRVPVRRDAGVDSTGGRGLLLLDRLAAAWGVARRDDGKAVWFDVALHTAEVR